MNVLDYVLLGIIVVLFIMAVVFIIRQKKKGKCLCCSDCSGCSMSGKCSKNK